MTRELCANMSLEVSQDGICYNPNTSAPVGQWNETLSIQAGVSYRLPEQEYF